MDEEVPISNLDSVDHRSEIRLNPLFKTKVHEMKALSVKQPWANMIASGEKTIETRTWVTRFRGPILILSSKQNRIEPAGCVVAVATLTDCRPMTQRDERAACCKIYPNAKAWVLEEIRQVEPVPMKGALGLFDCPLEIDDLRWP